MSNAVFDSLTNRGDTRSEGNESSVDNYKLAGENLAQDVYKAGENCWRNVLNTGAAAEQEKIDELLGLLVLSSDEEPAETFPDALVFGSIEQETAKLITASSSGDQAVSELSGAGGADGRAAETEIPVTEASQPVEKERKAMLIKAATAAGVTLEAVVASMEAVINDPQNHEEEAASKFIVSLMKLTGENAIPNDELRKWHHDIGKTLEEQIA